MGQINTSILTERIKETDIKKVLSFDIISGGENVDIECSVGGSSCIIRLKKYPISIQPNASEITVNSLGTYAINVNATFYSAGTEITKTITENEFDFLVETSDETIVDIPNSNRLKFNAVRNGNASATVRVTILNMQGEKTNLSFEIGVTIKQNAGQAFVFASGTNSILQDGSEVDIDYSQIQIDLLNPKIGTVDARAIKFSMYVLNSSNVLVEDECVYSLSVSNDVLVKIVNDGDNKEYIIISEDVTNNFKLKVKICTNMTMKDGSLFTIDLELTIKR